MWSFSRKGANKDIANNVSTSWITNCCKQAREVELGDMYDELLLRVSAAFGEHLAFITPLIQL